MEQPLISIIVPVYNTAPYLEKCLDSLVGQTYSNLEILCVDDGSPDESPMILEKYAQKDRRVIVIHQANTGLSGARNTGLVHASGKYVMYVDSDDWIDLDTCRKAVEEAESNHCDLVFWSYVREFGDVSKPKFILGEKKQVLDEIEVKKLHRRIIGLYGEELCVPENADSLVTAWGKLYLRSAISGISFVDTREIGTEDAFYNIQVFEYLHRAVYLPECLNHYRKDNQDSLTKGYNKNLFIRWQCLYDRIESYIAEKQLTQDYITAFYNRISLGMIGISLNRLKSGEGMVKDVQEIKRILCMPRYKEAFGRLTLHFFPLHWKVFFLCCKCRFAWGVYGLVCCMQKMIGK